MKKTYFIDTSYFIALASKLDQYHDKAVKLAKQILSKNIKLITSEFILLEVGNSFSKMHLKQKGINIIKSVYDDENIELITLSNQFYESGLKIFFRENDKNWSLTDCISFSIMHEKEINDSLTSDIHFIQAGFNKLL